MPEIYLCVMGGTEQDQQEFRARRKSDRERGWDVVDAAWDDLNHRVLDDFQAERIWIGETPWLKGLVDIGLGDAEASIPGPVLAIQRLFDDFPEVDADLIVSAHAAMQTANTTAYSVATPDAVAQWLGDHWGARITLESL